jgi:uncharacterized repeat protein (TIGR03803 family)
MGLITRIAQAQTFTVLHQFKGGQDGSEPFEGLVADSGGYLYGATLYGGMSGYGTVYRVSSKTGRGKVLYSFKGGADGMYPWGSLMPLSDNLYGTTQLGGAFEKGTLFKLDKLGVHTVVYDFRDGVPRGALARDAAGNIYGTSVMGGDFDCGYIFRLDVNENFSVLHSFSQPEGRFPYSGVRLFNGKLYGVAYNGGVSDAGAIFQFDLSTGILTTLHSFAGGPDGSNPMGRVVVDLEGNVYGATQTNGDPICACGVVYKLENTGVLRVLHFFTGLNGDGANAMGGLESDASGNLYGTTVSGGVGLGYGTVFKVDPTGTFTILYDFTGLEGIQPYSSVVLDPAGSIYGTTDGGGGNSADGIVYKLVP